MPASLIYTDPTSGGRLYQGGAQDVLEIGEPDRKIRLVVLAAAQWQPKIIGGTPRTRTAAAYPYQESVTASAGKFSILRVPLEDVAVMDSATTYKTAKDALAAAKIVAKTIQNGENVMNSCWAGYNRSSLVSALALRLLTNSDPETIIQTIKQNRDPNNALSNELFLQIIRSI